MFGDEILLIIGNGFDIDLGLKTRYSDFIESGYYPSIYNRLLLNIL